MESDAVIGPLRRREVPQAVWLLGGLAVASVAIAVLFVVKGSDVGTAGGPVTATKPTAAKKTGLNARRPGSCGIWPQVESFVPPPGRNRPGLHVWVDVKQWHVRLVPTTELGTVTGTVTIDGGGATGASSSIGSAAADAGGAHILLASPAPTGGGSPSAYEALWKVPCTTHRLTIELRDGGRQPIALDHIDVGAGFTATADPLTFER